MTQADAEAIRLADELSAAIKARLALQGKNRTAIDAAIVKLMEALLEALQQSRYELH